MQPLYYRRLHGYKYGTTRERRFLLQWEAGDNWTKRHLEVRPPGNQSAKIEGWIELTCDCWLIIQPGYAWDGTSGPTIDTKSSMRGGLIHDALYQLMRSSELDHKRYQLPVDQVFRQVLLDDRMWRPRAGWHYRGVRLFGAKHAAPQVVKGEREYVAPGS